MIQSLFPRFISARMCFLPLRRYDSLLLRKLAGKGKLAEHMSSYNHNTFWPLTEERGKWGTQRLQLWYQLDLQLWMKLLQHVTTEGVPINNTVFVKPSVTIWSDTYEYGIGGYTKNGLVWRWRIISVWHGKLTLNLIELLVSVENIYMTILQMGQVSHILAFTDSFSALGWIHKSYLNPLKV